MAHVAWVFFRSTLTLKNTSETEAALTKFIDVPLMTCPVQLTGMN